MPPSLNKGFTYLLTYRFWPEKLHQLYSVRGFVSEIWMFSRDSSDSDDKCHVVVGFETAESRKRNVSLVDNKFYRDFRAIWTRFLGMM